MDARTAAILNSLVPPPSHRWFKMPDHTLLMGDVYAAPLPAVLAVVDPFQKHWHAIPCAEVQGFMTRVGIKAA